MVFQCKASVTAGTTVSPLLGPPVGLRLLLSKIFNQSYNQLFCKLTYEQIRIPALPLQAWSRIKTKGSWSKNISGSPPLRVASPISHTRLSRSPWKAQTDFYWVFCLIFLEKAKALRLYSNKQSLCDLPICISKTEFITKNYFVPNQISGLTCFVQYWPTKPKPIVLSSH